jgi:hypothetical protein
VRPKARQQQTEVSFYLPFTGEGVSQLPTRIDDYWHWLLENRHVNKGKYSWTLQTYLHLQEAGFPCRLSEKFPHKGIVVSHRDFLPVFLAPRAGVFLICIKPDRKEHTWAEYYVVQNTNDRTFNSRAGKGRTAALPYWPQPSLIPRDAQRGQRVANVAYLGRTLNLATELKSDAWRNDLATLGLTWSTVEFDHWHDYQTIDVTVSVRSFAEHSSSPIFHPDSKPPSKLVNSWLAGVPAILGAESAYQSLRRDSLDYIEVSSPNELREALRSLRDDKNLYRGMVERGNERAREYSTRAVRERWVRLFENDIHTALNTWESRTPARRFLSSMANLAAYFADTQNQKDLFGALVKTLR